MQLRLLGRRVELGVCRDVVVCVYAGPQPTAIHIFLIHIPSNTAIVI